MKNKIILILIIIINLIFLSRENCVLAQQSIINLPTPQVLKPGKYALVAKEAFRPYKKDWYSYQQAPFIIFGIPYAELQISPPLLIKNGETVPQVNLAIKSTLNITKTTTFTGTYKTFIDLNEQRTPFNLTYLTFAQEVPKINTRFTSGIYLANQKDYLPNKVGAALGYEWSIKPEKLMLVADWQSGTESYTLLGSGIKYFPTPSSIITLGTLVPNNRNSKFAFYMSYIKYMN
ncbi:MAG: hypothetical protein WC197_02380 [Candidatus Gastranaerophilaceae bacterium]|jgi:hypothetical protein